MLKTYEELVKVDVSKFTEKRDGMDYLNWAKCVDLLHENGAKVVYFEPLVNPTTEGVVLLPSAFVITVGSPPSMIATHEFVVPRSIPIIFPILIISYLSAFCCNL